MRKNEDDNQDDEEKDRRRYLPRLRCRRVSCPRSSCRQSGGSCREAEETWRSAMAPTSRRTLPYRLSEESGMVLSALLSATPL
eukprot:751939-Hanusia_phi.AAC.3